MRLNACLVVVCLFVCGLAEQSQTFAQSAGPVPSPWVSADVGSPSPSGSATFDQGQFAISGGGPDIWGASDQFRFVYQQIAGDVEIVASVDSLSPADGWSKVGVMIRGDLTPGAANAFALLSGSNGLAFQQRAQAGSSTSMTTGAAATAPRWVRLVRAGTTVSGYASADGSTWTKMASATIALGDTAYVGLAITSHVDGTLAQATVSQVGVTSLALPTGQQAADIGSPVIAGSSTYRNGVYTITAAGADIGGTSDQFRFVYQPVSGDLDIVARVSSLQRVRAWSKAGVMVRESLSADARNVMALLSAGKGYSFQWRLDQGGTTDYTLAGSGVAPGWVRLRRSGQTFEAFRSNDGAAWISMGTQAVAMADTVYVGLAVTSHTTSRTTTATIDQVGTAQAVTSPNQPPTVTLTAPASGSTYSAPADIVVSASASDPENRLARVEFYANTTRIGSVTSAPYSVTWSGVPSGTYSLTAVAFDLDGGSATSPAVTIDVGTANQPPTVSLTAPTSGATFTAPATIALSASASDPENRMARVEFYAGANLIGTATAAPYSAKWDSVAAGTYSLTAVAYDQDGGKTTSAPVGISVSANQPPTVTLTSPLDGAAFVAPATVSLAATASDPEGRLAKVEFYVGSTLIATDTASPFAASWSATATGSYYLEAVAYDADGGVTTSAVASITVTSAPRYVVFQASADQATLVNGYRLDVFANGADPTTATPTATSDLGKPAPDPTTNDITVDRYTFFSALSSGAYVATVSAIGSGGESRSAPISFVR